MGGVYGAGAFGTLTTAAMGALAGRGICGWPVSKDLGRRCGHAGQRGVASRRGVCPEARGARLPPLDGARFLRGRGFPDRVVNLVAFHSGAAVEARELGLDAQLAAFIDERTWSGICSGTPT